MNLPIIISSLNFKKDQRQDDSSLVYIVLINPHVNGYHTSDNELHYQFKSFLGAEQAKDIAKELDDLTRKVVTTALAAKRSDAAQQELNIVQRQWREKVQQLTSAIDDMFSPQELVAATGELYFAMHSV